MTPSVPLHHVLHEALQLGSLDPPPLPEKLRHKVILGSGAAASGEGSSSSGRGAAGGDGAGRGSRGASARGERQRQPLDLVIAERCGMINTGSFLVR